jgi:hypothetical protein
MTPANESKRIECTRQNSSAEHAELARWESEGGRTVREQHIYASTVEQVPSNFRAKRALAGHSALPMSTPISKAERRSSSG